MNLTQVLQAIQEDAKQGKISFSDAKTALEDLVKTNAPYVLFNHPHGKPTYHRGGEVYREADILVGYHAKTDTSFELVVYNGVEPPARFPMQIPAGTFCLAWRGKNVFPSIRFVYHTIKWENVKGEFTYVLANMDTPYRRELCHMSAFILDEDGWTTMSGMIGQRVKAIPPLTPKMSNPTQPQPQQTMSVCQGLAELKMLDKRIRKFEYAIQWADVSTKIHPVDAEKLRRVAESEFQSYMDLVKRRDTIKKAIVVANAATQVKIGSWEGSVAEAIEHKSSISYKKTLVDMMRTCFLSAKAKLEEEQKATNDRLDRLLQSELGKDVRTNPETIQAITNSFRENNKVEFVDPLGLEKRIKELDEEIEAFETNVDWVLSEANGRTMIQV